LIITVKNLAYSYLESDEEVLYGLNFEIAEKEIFGFLGPSGAGKTTTQNILIGLLRGYGGHIEMMDKELREWGDGLYEHVGVSFEFPNHYLKLTAFENLNYFKSLYNHTARDAMDVLRQVGLEEDAHKRVAKFSKGMKVRLNVARSIIHKPKLLFLDEPTAGLDPVNARNIKDLILELRDEGTTVFVTTHDMAVADELCDRVGFITAGNLNLIEAPSELKKRYGRRNVRVEYEDGTGAIEQQEFPLDGLGDNHAFTDLLQSTHIETIHTQETTLENIFIEVTGQELTV
jgi:fluoroquinolone transport system ATP-binding protein